MEVVGDHGVLVLYLLVLTDREPGSVSHLRVPAHIGSRDLSLVYLHSPKV